MALSQLNLRSPVRPIFGGFTRSKHLTWSLGVSRSIIIQELIVHHEQRVMPTNGKCLGSLAPSQASERAAGNPF